MKGFTLYIEDIKYALEQMTDEELGFVLKAFLNGCESEEIPTFEDSRLDFLASGFKVSFMRTLNNMKKKRKKDNGVVTNRDKQIWYGKFCGTSWNKLLNNNPNYIDFLIKHNYPVPLKIKEKIYLDGIHTETKEK